MDKPDKLLTFWSVYSKMGREIVNVVRKQEF